MGELLLLLLFLIKFQSLFVVVDPPGKREGRLGNRLVLLQLILLLLVAIDVLAAGVVSG